MASYTDRAHVLERVSVATNQGARVYYRRPSFWQASVAVDLPSRINNTNYQGLNGFDSRCSAYGVALAVLTEMRFADANDQAALWYPEGYIHRGERDEKSVCSTLHLHNATFYLIRWCDGRSASD